MRAIYCFHFPWSPSNSGSQGKLFQKQNYPFETSRIASPRPYVRKHHLPTTSTSIQCRNNRKSCSQNNSSCKHHPQEPKLNQELFLIGKSTMGIDFGKKNIGISLTIGFQPNPSSLIQHNNQPDLAAKKIAQLVEENLVTMIVIGWPLNSKGEEGHQVWATRRFLKHLAVLVPWTDIYLWDERFTTIIARAQLEKRGLSQGLISSQLDSAASMQILNEFYEAHGVGAWLYRQASTKAKFQESIIGEFSSYSEWKQKMMRLRAMDSETCGSSKSALRLL